MTEEGFEMMFEMMPPIYIAIEGAIGVGKTTLATLLQPEYKAQLMLEVFEENPFLPLFYADPERYAFQVQIDFLLWSFYLRGGRLLARFENNPEGTELIETSRRDSPLYCVGPEVGV